MDPLNVQMVIGSPQTLRSKTSLSTLIGRKKKAPHGNKLSAKKTPSRLTKIDEDSQSPSAELDSVRTRRGFRPLSVFTNSILLPFESETLKAMDELEDVKDPAAGEMADRVSTPGAGELAAASSLSKKSVSATVLPSSSDSDMSIRAFLAQSSPPTTPRVIKGPFSMLQDIPAPDISQHPAFADDPFASQSDAPRLVTTTSISEIKRIVREARNNSSFGPKRSSTSSDVFGSIESDKLIFGEQQSSPTTPLKPKSFSTTESSPVSKIHPKSCPIEISYTGPDTPSADPGKKRSGSGGIRKLSDMFKSRSNSSQSSETSPASPDEPPQRTMQELERYLRIVLVSPTYEYTEGSWLPPHPVTGRFWRSRNLKCTNCVDVSCACCGKTCCAYKTSVMALETHRGMPSREFSVDMIHQITALYPYGRELPTFLRCTKDVVEGRGCGKLVCPECCGMCPNEICADIQCRKCKKDPWAECDWHAHENQSTPATTTKDTSMRRTV